jgi:hypothetical protein
LEQVREGAFYFLGVFDFLSIIFWLIILIFVVNSNYNKNKHLFFYKYYKLAFYFKLIIAVLFSIIFIIFYYGGDTTAYWDTAQKLNNLFWHNPSGFFSEMFSIEPTRERFINFYPPEVGLPPTWIYKEDEAFFTSKIFTILTFFTFRSYFAMTMICSFISFKVSWMIYEYVVQNFNINIRTASIGILFLPSTAFWCTGISKDMLIYSCVVYLLISFFNFKNNSDTSYKPNYFYIIVCLFIIYNIRDFMLIAVIGPISLAYGVRLANKQKSTFTKTFIQLLFVFSIMFLMVSFMQSTKAQEFTLEAKVIQEDLRNNQTYGTNKYDLGITDFTPFGMVKAMPISLFTSIYRPFIWEAQGLFVQLSALETMFFTFFTLSFIFNGNLFKKIAVIRNNDFLLACLTFSIILGFFAGYTSGLFGVLVRFKAPLLPFLFLVLMYKKENELPKLESKS